MGISQVIAWKYRGFDSKVQDSFGPSFLLIPTQNSLFYIHDKCPLFPHSIILRAQVQLIIHHILQVSVILDSFILHFLLLDV